MKQWSRADRDYLSASKQFSSSCSSSQERGFRVVTDGFSLKHQQLCEIRSQLESRESARSTGAAISGVFRSVFRKRRCQSQTSPLCAHLAIAPLLRPPLAWFAFQIARESRQFVSYLVYGASHFSRFHWLVPMVGYDFNYYFSTIFGFRSEKMRIISLNVFTVN